MYLRRFKLSHVKLFDALEWSLPAGVTPEGWHVIIGDNASGKSTILRALALALMGPPNALASRVDLGAMMTSGQADSRVELELDYDSELDPFVGGGPLPAASVGALLELARALDGRAEVTVKGGKLKKLSPPSRHLWGGGRGWFSAGFGPQRRFTGGDKEYDRLFFSHPRLAAHLSLFGEDIALTEALRWLQQLRFKELEEERELRLLADLRAFINQPGFLPHGAQLKEISSSGVFFSDSRGVDITLDALSDGFRSILSFTLELIRLLAQAYGEEGLFISAGASIRIDRPGLVLVDEIDAHLHPSWQQRIGRWFSTHFPRVQFLVTTHSPLVCQAAITGSIFRLSEPGTSEEARFLSGVELGRLLYGDILEAYGTEAFGFIDRSPEGRQLQAELAALNARAMHGPLSEAEASRRDQLRAILPLTSAAPESAVEEQLERLLLKAKRFTAAKAHTGAEELP